MRCLHTHSIHFFRSRRWKRSRCTSPLVIGARRVSRHFCMPARRRRDRLPHTRAEECLSRAEGASRAGRVCAPCVLGRILSLAARLISARRHIFSSVERVKNGAAARSLLARNDNTFGPAAARRRPPVSPGHTTADDDNDSNEYKTLSRFDDS